MTGTVMTAAVTALFAFIWRTRLNPLMYRAFLGKGNWAIIAMYALMSIFFLATMGGFAIGLNRISHASIGSAIGIVASNILMGGFSVILIGRVKFISNVVWPFVWITVVDVFGLFGLTYFFTWAYRKVFPPYSILQIRGEHDNNLVNKMHSRRDKYHIDGTILYEESIEKIEAEIIKYDAVLLNDVPAEVRNRILKVCFDHHKRVYFTPKIGDIIVRESEELNLFDSPIYLSRNQGFSLTQSFVKRLGDIIISLIGIILSSPVMLVTAIVIKAYDGGPVFYRQTRYTIGHKKFRIFKFRSMITDAEKDGQARLATESDSRITPVGKFIRATRIDELPQFFNILLGDMSVVGPRPERPEIHIQYCEKVPEFDFRLAVKAGLTGYAQVYGKYNTTTYDKLKFDMIYVQKRSILLDLHLILLTLRVIFQKEATEGLEEGQKTADGR